MGEKDPFKVQNIPMDFTVTWFQKFIDIFSDSTLQLTFKNYHLIFMKTQRIIITIIQKSENIPPFATTCM